MNDHSIFFAFFPLWLEGLYLRLKPSTMFGSVAVSVFEDGVVYGTRMTVQASHPRQNCSALEAQRTGQAYFEGARVCTCTCPALSTDVFASRADENLKVRR